MLFKKRTKMNAIEFINISKSFGVIKANQDINIQIKKGTIHALIGENGAGKSTLLSILFGLYEPDHGIIKVNGKEVLINNPNDANNLGIGMVHQHFKLVGAYTNLQNIILGAESESKTFKTLDYKPSIKKIKTIQRLFNLNFDLNKDTGTESVSTQQKVEIMKMLYRDSEILIFDEPTAVLTDEEIQGLLETFKLFKSQGKTIIFISHKLKEVKAVADYATVIRHGKVTGNFEVANTSIEEMANRMVGDNIVMAQNQSLDVFEDKDTVLELENVSTKGTKSLKNLNLKVHAGEILAIAGVEGNGQQDLEYVVSGIVKPTKGNVYLKKTPLVEERVKFIHKNKIKNFIILSSLLALFIAFGSIFFGVSPFQQNYSNIWLMWAIGISFFALFAVGLSILIVKIIKFFKTKKDEEKLKDRINLNNYSVLEKSMLASSFIPSDRHKHGLALDYNIKNNTILRRLWDPKYQTFGFIKPKAVKKETAEVIDKYDVRGAREGYSTSRSLSGGNQQKFIVGREMNSPHDFILILQPTRVLDVGAIKNIHERILKEKAEGKAILLISYELDEVLSLADTIAVINEGEIRLSKPARELTRKEIGLYMAQKEHQTEGGTQ
ncbi:hypothetical protein MBIO_0761 [Mycoplasmopsis fermentans PG18]|uniref:ABC transporter domain-containing protein n=2 Tax=Mycoplasmopsis fermentans TaxID=2115 RepID=C4XFV4_MYCFP|nr:hypothetical protein MBIO_0761 [Mycoplasmopsis fermentans PG18]